MDFDVEELDDSRPNRSWLCDNFVLKDYPGCVKECESYHIVRMFWLRYMGGEWHLCVLGRGLPIIRGVTTGQIKTIMRLMK